MITGEGECMEDLWAISWNFDQGAGHHEPLVEYLKESKEKAIHGEKQSWILIGVGEDKETNEELTKFWCSMIKYGKAGEWYLKMSGNTKADLEGLDWLYTREELGLEEETV
jgi:hypothetical protein